MRYLLLFLVSLLFYPLSAENISKEEALLLAETFLRENRPKRSPRPALLLVHEKVSNRSDTDCPSYYIFNDVAGKGFVIVAGNDCVRPILGYSLEHAFSQESLPCNVSAWLDDMELQVKYAMEYNIVQPGNEANKGEVVVQLVTPTWGQDTPFNGLSPVLDGERTPAGCVMTAMAIVMRYFEWPEKGEGIIPSYISFSYEHAFPARELGHRYEWENMPYSYMDYSPEQANQVSTLLFDLGMIMEADYAPGGTGAYSHMIAGGLQTYMGYDQHASEFYRNSYSSEEWNDMIQNELDHGRPVIYGGYNRSKTGGHSFVLDGYTSTDYYSVNWGWDGRYNGYFLLSALEPVGQGTGGNGSNYNYDQSALLGLMPSEDALNNGEKTIDESTSIRYNKDDSLLWVETKEGVQVSFEDELGVDKSHLCRKEGLTVVIDVSNLLHGTYLLKLQHETESRVLKFRLKGKNVK